MYPMINQLKTKQCPLDGYTIWYSL